MINSLILSLPTEGRFFRGHLKHADHACALPSQVTKSTPIVSCTVVDLVTVLTG